MRVLFGAAAALSLAVPAVSFAQDKDPQTDNGGFEEVDPAAQLPGIDDDHDTSVQGMNKFGHIMNAPKMQARMGDGLESVVDMMFELPIGGLLNAVEGMDQRARNQNQRRYDSRMTMGDLASRDNPNLRQDMRQTVRQFPQMMGSLAEALDEMAPVIERTMKRVGRNFDPDNDRN